MHKHFNPFYQVKKQPVIQNIWGERILHFWASFLPIGCDFVGITTFPFWFDKMYVEIFSVFFLELMFRGQVSLDNLKK